MDFVLVGWWEKEEGKLEIPWYLNDHNSMQWYISVYIIVHLCCNLLLAQLEVLSPA